MQRDMNIEKCLFVCTHNLQPIQRTVQSGLGCGRGSTQQDSWKGAFHVGGSSEHNHSVHRDEGKSCQYLKGDFEVS